MMQDRSAAPDTREPSFPGEWQLDGQARSAVDGSKCFFSFFPCLWWDWGVREGAALEIQVWRNVSKKLLGPLTPVSLLSVLGENWTS